MSGFGRLGIVQALYCRASLSLYGSQFSMLELVLGLYSVLPKQGRFTFGVEALMQQVYKLQETIRNDWGCVALGCFIIKGFLSGAGGADSGGSSPTSRPSILTVM